MLKGETVQSSVESIYEGEKRVEEELKEFGEKFHTLLNLIPDPVVIVDGKGNFLAVNDRVEEKTGFKREDLLGKNFLRTKIVTTKSKAILIKNLAKRMMGMYVAPYEVEVLTKDGGRLMVEINAAKVEYKGKSADMVVFRDVTERRQMEKALRESEEKYRKQFEEALDAIFLVDAETGIIIGCNHAASELMGREKSELVGKHQRILHPPQEIEGKFSRTFKKHLEEREGLILEAKVITKKEEIKDVAIKANVFELRGKKVMQGLFRDITQKKMMEKKLMEYAERLEEMVGERTRELNKAHEQLLKSERFAAIGELATMVGHDLRNPLQSIENATYYLSNQLSRLPPSIPIPQKTMEMVQIITDSVTYADKILRDLHDFSAMKEPLLQNTDINAIVVESLSLVKTPANVELITELGHLPEIEADKDMLKRVFMNLAANGMQAMENGGTLKVSTKETERFVEVTFKDTGAGISKENMEKIFTPFFTTKAKGMGIGLAICKRFVEVHGGSIGVISREGKGSIFTVRLHIPQKNGGENR